MFMKLKYNKTLKVATQQEIKTCEKAVKEEVMAVILLHGANKTRYRGLKCTLAQNMAHYISSVP